MSKINYEPLEKLIGTWKGNQGTDITPEPDGSEENTSYYETLTFEAVGDVDNAEDQNLTILHYHQVMQRMANDELFHHQCGYWTWDAATEEVTHAFTTPRGVAVVACGKASIDGETTIIEVGTMETGVEGGIVQPAFMLEKARTKAFSQVLTIEGNRLSYEQNSLLYIYSSDFEHTDSNQLTRQD